VKIRVWAYLNCGRFVLNKYPLLPQDSTIIQGLKGCERERLKQEKLLYEENAYLIEKEGCHKHRLSYDESISAYHDALRSVIENIVHDRFDGNSSIKTYLYKIFSHKCIDQIRKNTTNKNGVHNTAPLPELVNQLPDSARTIVECMMTRELKERVKEELKALGKKSKEILLLYEDGLTDKEIAERLSYNNAAVAKTTRLRCLEKLRAKVVG
jgi:RNA polymerase sigma factor (sigma-70 family)